MSIRDLPIPTVGEEPLKRIGEIAVYFSLLEHLLGASVRSLLGTEPEIGKIVAAKLSRKELVELFEVLYSRQALGKKQRRELRKLKTQVENVSKDRNKILHSVWSKSGSSDDLVTRKRLTRNWPPSFDIQTVSTSDLEKIRDAIAEAIRSLLSMMWYLVDSVDASDSDGNSS